MNDRHQNTAELVISPETRAARRQAEKAVKTRRFSRRTRLLLTLPGFAAAAGAAVAAVYLLSGNGTVSVDSVSSNSRVGSPVHWGGGGHHHRHPKPTPTPTASPTHTATPTPTPKPTATTPTSSPTATIPITTGAFPGSSNTGVTAGTTLTKVSGNYTATGSVSNLDISGGLVIKGSNVTVKNVRVRCEGVADFCVSVNGNGDTLSGAEIGGGADGASWTSAIGVWAGGDSGSATSTRLDKLNVHNTSDGLRIDGYTTVSNSYIHELNYNNGIHADGDQTTSGPHIVFEHNTFVGGTNCTIFLQPTGDQPISDVKIDNNLLQPDDRQGQMTSYGICVDPAVTGVSVTNNHIAASGWQVGPASQGYRWASWLNNVFTTGAALKQP